MEHEIALLSVESSTKYFFQENASGMTCSFAILAKQISQSLCLGVICYAKCLKNGLVECEKIYAWNLKATWKTCGNYYIYYTGHHSIMNDALLCVQMGGERGWCVWASVCVRMSVLCVCVFSSLYIVCNLKYY